MGQVPTSSGGSYFYANPKNIKNGLPEFPTWELTQKKGDNYEVVNTVGALTGHITELSLYEKDHPQFGKLKGIKMTMEDIDDKEKYFFNLLYSGPVREMLNRFASMEDFLEKIKIGFYRNDNKYAGCSVKVMKLSGDEKLELKFKYDEHLKHRIKTVRVNGKDVKDYEEVDKFFDELVTRKLSSYKMIDTAAHTNTSSHGYTGPDDPEIEQPIDKNDGFDDDLPF